MQTENCTQQERSELAAVCADLVSIWKKDRTDSTVCAKKIRKSGNFGCTDAVKIRTPEKFTGGGKCLIISELNGKMSRRSRCNYLLRGI